MRLITANVNGIRAAARRGGLAWLKAQAPDVLALQEVRASDAQLADALGAAGLGDWHVAHTEAPDQGPDRRRGGQPGASSAGRCRVRP